MDRRIDASSARSELVARRHWAAAASALDDCAGDLPRLGGSNEQHSLIHEVIGFCRHQAGAGAVAAFHPASVGNLAP